jgi:hypothetical protein
MDLGVAGVKLVEDLGYGIVDGVLLGWRESDQSATQATPVIRIVVAGLAS